jgi:SAM-dependent methyltransferase
VSVARSASSDDLREHILSGYKGGKPFTPYVPTLTLPAPVGAVLDFGCGVGRNFPYLKSVARSVAGFDLPPMIERCRALAADPVDLLMDEWQDARGRRFDLIFASLVLQHIEPTAYRAYLEDFAHIAPAVYLLTRVEDDFGTNVLGVAADTGLFDAGECVEVDHDPDTHQLRILGHRPFVDARAFAPTAHYEVLLRSRAPARPPRR